MTLSAELHVFSSHARNSVSRSARTDEPEAISPSTPEATHAKRKADTQRESVVDFYTDCRDSSSSEPFKRTVLPEPILQRSSWALSVHVAFKFKEPTLNEQTTAVFFSFHVLDRRCSFDFRVHIANTVMSPQLRLHRKYLPGSTLNYIHRSWRDSWNPKRVDVFYNYIHVQAGFVPDEWDSEHAKQTVCILPTNTQPHHQYLRCGCPLFLAWGFSA